MIKIKIKIGVIITRSTLLCPDFDQVTALVLVEKIMRNTRCHSLQIPHNAFSIDPRSYFTRSRTLIKPQNRFCKVLDIS